MLDMIITGYNPADINRFRSHTGKVFSLIWALKQHVNNITTKTIKIECHEVM